MKGCVNWTFFIQKGQNIDKSLFSFGKERLQFTQPFIILCILGSNFCTKLWWRVCKQMLCSKSYTLAIVTHYQWPLWIMKTGVSSIFACQGIKNLVRCQNKNSFRAPALNFVELTYRVFRSSTMIWYILKA